MQYQISPLPNDFGSKFVKIRYQALYVEKIKKLSASIHNVLNKQSQYAAHTKLEDQKFWKSLKESAPLSQEVESLHQSWLEVRGFSYLATRELLSLYKDKIRPLEQAYLRASFEIEADLKHYQEFGTWRPKWYLTRQQTMLDTINHRLDELTILTNDTIKALAVRCLLYKQFDIDRHDDNFLYVICQKLAKHSSDETIANQQSQHNYLSDDERLEIFDILRSFNPSEIGKFFPIVKDVRNALFTPVVEQKENEKQASTILSRAAKIESLNQLVSIAKLKAARDQSRIEKLREKSWFGQLKKYLGADPLVKLLFGVYRLRYLILTAITMSLFLAYVPLIISPIALMSQTLANVTTGILLFAFGLSPMLLAGWDKLTSIYQGVENYFCHFKRQGLHQALETIKDNQRAITEQLTAGVHDTAHVDLNRLEAWATTFSLEASKLRNELPNLSFLEKLFAPKKLKYGLAEASILLDTQNNLVKQRLKLYAAHIVERLSQDIAKLTLDVQAGFKISISKGQIEKLRNFVKRHGTAEDLINFQAAISLMPQFKQNLLDRDYLIQGRHIANTPWGGFKPFQGALNGWSILLKESGIDVKTTDKLLLLLKGEVALSSKELNEFLSSIENNDTGLLSAIQAHLFACLDHMPTETVHLLSIEQKRMIRDWFERSNSEINIALGALKHFIKDQTIDASKNSLSKYIGLLDGAVIASQLLDSKPNAPYNLARQALEKYSGFNPKMFYLMRFFPEHERGHVANTLATKRLNYILDNPSTVLTDTDREIFINIRHLTGSGFDFASTVKQHQLFSKPWNKEYELILEKFKNSGIDDGGLLKSYEWLNKYAKSFVVQSEESLQAISRRVVANV